MNCLIQWQGRIGFRVQGSDTFLGSWSLLLDFFALINLKSHHLKT